VKLGQNNTDGKNGVKQKKGGLGCSCLFFFQALKENSDQKKSGVSIFPFFFYFLLSFPFSFPRVLEQVGTRKQGSQSTDWEGCFRPDFRPGLKLLTPS